MAVFAVSAMFVSCNKQGQGEESSEDDGTKYALFFNYGTDSHITNETPVLSEILNKAKKLTVEADIALYGGTRKESPFRQELSAKTEKDAKAEYNKLVEKAKSKEPEADGQDTVFDDGRLAEQLAIWSLYQAHEGGQGSDAPQ